MDDTTPDNVTDADVMTTGCFDEIPGLSQWIDDNRRCEEADNDDRTPPPAAPARSHVILTAGGAVGACSTIVRGDTIGAVKFTPAEAAEYLAARPNLRDAVVATIACPLCLAGKFHGSESCRQTFAPAPTIAANVVTTPARGWETSVGNCAGRKPYLATVITPAGRKIKVGKFASESEAWAAAEARLAAEKSQAA